MKYEVHTPCPDLQDFIKCFWTLKSDDTAHPERQRILPDGCMELIFHYDDLYRQYLEDGTYILQPRSFIFGQISRYLDIEPTGTTGIIAARFMPDGLFAFLPIDPRLLENKATDIKELFGAKGEKLEMQVISAESDQQRLEIIEKFLLAELTAPQNISTVTKNCVETIILSCGQLEVSALAAKMKLNRRSLERQFSKLIGLSPKQLSKAVRLQATLKSLSQNKIHSLTSLAYEHGYFDQSHFIKEFKEFTGLSPKIFYSDNLQLATLFANED